MIEINISMLKKGQKLFTFIAFAQKNSLNLKMKKVFNM